MIDHSIKAEWARQILTDPQFEEAFEEMRQQLYADIRNSQPDEGFKRDNAYHEISALDRIRAKLQGYLDNQKIADHRNKE